MHNTRKTHNAHNETQRRLRKASEVGYFRYAPYYKERDGKGFYAESRVSTKYFKKITHRFFRRNKDIKFIKIANKKTLDFVCDRWEIE